MKTIHKQIALLLLLSTSFLVKGFAQVDKLKEYNPCWTTQSKDASESMPCGGGDMGMNVWVEKDEVLFYLSRSGTFDENNVYPKLGRVRLSLTPNPFEGAQFRQELKLKDGYVEIEAIKGGKRTTINVWANVFSPVVEVSIQSDNSLSVTATYETWRTEPLTWTQEREIHASIAYRGAPVKATIQPDTVRLENDQVFWYHRNREITLFDLTVEQQHLSGVKHKLWNPLRYLTFGGYMKGKDMIADGTCSGRYVDTDFTGFRLKSKSPKRQHQLSIVLHTAQTETLDQWTQALNETGRVYEKNAKQEKLRSRKWWSDFWDRSYVIINADSAAKASPSWQIGRNYQLLFYDKHYQYLAAQRSAKTLDGNGKLILYPSTGCETYKMAYNASNTIGALKSVTDGLLQLPENYLTKEQRDYWAQFEKRIPDIPFRVCDGHQTIAPAITWERINNMEITQLYPVFPWGLYGVGLPNLDIAINTWKYGVDHANQKNYISWHQDAIFCARMGLIKEAKEITLKKMSDSPRRYPTFWGPGHDWVPDHNWGGSGMIGVQEMLLQAVGEKIYLLPAWPKEWNVDFKLCAPGNTVIECTLKDGKVTQLTVFPKEREQDIVIM